MAAQARLLCNLPRVSVFSARQAMHPRDCVVQMYRLNQTLKRSFILYKPRSQNCPGVDSKLIQATPRRLVPYRVMRLVVYRLSRPGAFNNETQFPCSDIHFGASYCKRLQQA